MTKPSIGKRILERLEGFAESLKQGEKIEQSFTCRQVVLDLKPLPATPETVQKIRELLRVSQAIFALFLGVSVRTVQAWEQGKTTPSEMARRWFDEIRRDPDYWRERLEQAMVEKEPARISRRTKKTEA